MHNSTFLTILIMKKIAGLICLLMVSVAFSGMDDKVLRFSTPGPDRYADGSIVADGECYALVWSPKGKTFSGFNANGTPVSSSDFVVLAAPLAQNGRCIDSIFQVPAEEYEVLKNGEMRGGAELLAGAVWTCRGGGGRFGASGRGVRDWWSSRSVRRQGDACAAW